MLLKLRLSVKPHQLLTLNLDNFERTIIILRIILQFIKKIIN